jgi:hypothetical protein
LSGGPHRDPAQVASGRHGGDVQRVGHRGGRNGA